MNKKKVGRPKKSVDERYVRVDITLPRQIVSALDSYLELTGSMVSRSEAIAIAIVKLITVEVV